jgi:two-component system phosphate regulon sensor histidine kinase PhoR
MADPQMSSSVAIAGLELSLSAVPVTTDSDCPEAMVVHLHDMSHLMAMARMQRSFVTSISHELRTPVTAIKLYASMIATHPERVEGYVSPLVESTDRLSALVDDVFVIARLDAGRQALRMAAVDAVCVAARAVDAFLPDVDHDISLAAQPDYPVLAFGDEVALEQAICELLQNAVLYSASGTTITVSIGCDQEDQLSSVWWRVSDQGMGIPADELPHVFDRFFRGGQVVETKIAGTGLGLAIAKQIAVLHSGTICVDSRVGEGSTFTLRVPAMRKAD